MATTEARKTTAQTAATAHLCRIIARVQRSTAPRLADPGNRPDQVRRSERRAALRARTPGASRTAATQT